jgi:uncharacterized DUF497 family protein
MKVEWDTDKEASNLNKHGVDFEEASTALLDPMALAREDEDSEGEPRWIIIGMSQKNRLLTLIYTVRLENSIRIISARKATRTEATYYA